jgi:preprotein translocase subunit SecA
MPLTQRHGAEVMRNLEKGIMLQQLDGKWKEHLAAMDYLRQGIGLRGYAQKNPKQEYKREAFEMFSDMLERVKGDVTRILCRLELAQPDEAAESLQRQREAQLNQQLQRSRTIGAGSVAAPAAGGSGGQVAQGAPGRQAATGRARANVAARSAASQGAAPAAGADAATGTPFVRDRKVGRNEPCPCGSGRKYKQCHGRLG